MGYLITFLILVVLGFVIWGIYKLVISKKVQKIASDITSDTKVVTQTAQKVETTVSGAATQVKK